MTPGLELSDRRLQSRTGGGVPLIEEGLIEEGMTR